MSAESPPPFLRLFIALTVPPEVRQEIARAQGRLQRHSPPGAIRWTKPEQFHVTLKFLGDVPSEHVPALEKATAEVCAYSPALRLTALGIGFFPGAQKPRVLWAGVRDEADQLPVLHRQLDETLRWLAPAERPEKFTGHITLGRFKPGHYRTSSQLEELAALYRAQNFGEWTAQEVEIVRSELTSLGAEHSTLVSFPLAR